MPYHIKKTSILGSAVPTDGVEYYAGDNKWTNPNENMMQNDRIFLTFCCIYSTDDKE